MLNRESLIVNFIKDNLKLLQRRDFPEDLFKTIKHHYFYVKLKNEIGKPKDSEIAHVAMFYFIRKHMLKDDSEITKVLDLPFFNDHIRNKEIYHSAFSLNDPSAEVAIDPSKVDDVEYQQQIAKQIKDQIVLENKSLFQEERDKYQKEIESLRKQLATIPTILESQEYQEPVIEEEQTPYNPEWWETLNLKEDPFPQAEGLQKIDKEIYEQIIVRTEIFERYVNYAERVPNQIFKNTIFYGNFGCGKTAFFDYFKEILLRNKILSVSVSLWPVGDVDTNIHKFEEELVDRLRESCNFLNLHINQKTDSNYLQIIRSMLSELSKQRGFKGFVVVVDDLHKNVKAFEAVIDFLSYLQIFTSNLIKGTDFNFGLYVAGIPSWGDRISSDPRLSGSLIREEKFPVISELDAYNMLNKRLMTFSKNPEKKNIIGKSFVRQIYDGLQKNNQSITFREFLRKALVELRNGNFDILTVNPKAISTETLESIRRKILENHRLNYQFEALLSLTSTRQSENKQKCFELLGITYIENGVFEDTQQTERNKWAFQQLERCGLIHLTTSNGRIKWLVNKDLLEVNRQIMSIYNVSMEEYLIPIFVGKQLQKKRKQVTTPEIETLSSLVNQKTNNNEVQMIKESIRIHRSLLEIESTHSLNVVPSELVGNCIMSLSALTKAFLLSQKITQKANDDLEVLSFWERFWYQLPSMIEFLNQTLGNWASLDITRANYIFGLYKESFESLTMFINRQDQKDRVFSISYGDLTADDCKILDSARESWYERDYFSVAQTLSQHIENKLRQTVFNIFVLQYGPFEKRIRRIDESIRSRVFENMKKDGRKGFEKAINELQYLDRKDYKNLMTSATKVGRLNWEEIFRYVFSPLDESKLDRYLNSFANINTATSHLKTEVIKANQQNELLPFVIDSMMFLKKLNGAYRMLITSCLSEKDKNYYFSFHNFKDQMSLFEIAVNPNDAKRLVQRWCSMEEIEVDLSNSEFIESFYNIEYRNFVAILARLLRVVDDAEYAKAGVKLTVSKDDSPSFSLNISQKKNG